MNVLDDKDSDLWPISGESLEKLYLEKILKVSEPFASYRLIENDKAQGVTMHSALNNIEADVESENKIMDNPTPLSFEEEDMKTENLEPFSQSFDAMEDHSLGDTDISPKEDIMDESLPLMEEPSEEERQHTLVEENSISDFQESHIDNLDDHVEEDEASEDLEVTLEDPSDSDKSSEYRIFSNLYGGAEIMDEANEEDSSDVWLDGVHEHVQELAEKSREISLEEQIENLLKRVVELQEKEVHLESLLTETKRELEDILSEVDTIIAQLPKEKIEEFERKKYQSLYGKVYDSLGI